MSVDRARQRVLLDREYAGLSSTLRHARNDVAGCLRAHVLDPDMEERAQLVVSELATNAIQASPGRMYTLRMTLLDDGAVVMAVTSSTEAEAAPPPRGAWGPAHPIAPSGRGLMIVGELTEQVEVARPVPGTIVVTATLRTTAPA